MSRKRAFGIIATVLLLAVSPGRAQVVTHELATATADAAPTALSETNGQVWAFSLPITFSFIPDTRDYGQPTLTADHDWLHLEARYNYEALETGSIWVGYNFSFGDKLSLDFTPMLGGVFGEMTGIAPGYEFTLSYWKLVLYSEGEYVFDTGNSSGNFFYTWSELSLAPVDWFRFGLVVQRTKVYQNELDIQRGFLVGCTYKQWDFTTYLLNPDQDKPTVVLALVLNF
ncbi:MAG: hypothetical protein IT579_03730 [Verrucomicrobia subdivision 3 bacterium]|nr:hypothetical protein [Limisphaerales bacterium]